MFKSRRSTVGPKTLPYSTSRLRGVARHVRCFLTDGAGEPEVRRGTPHGAQHEVGRSVDHRLPPAERLSRSRPALRQRWQDPLHSGIGVRRYRGRGCPCFACSRLSVLSLRRNTSSSKSTGRSSASKQKISSLSVSTESRYNSFVLVQTAWL